MTNNIIYPTRDDVAAARSARGLGDAPAPAKSVTVVSNAGYSFDGMTGTVERQGSGSVQMSPDAQPGSSSILATARSATGAPVDPSRITESTVVKFDGMEMRVVDAVRAGLLQRTPEGAFVENGAKATERQPQKTEKTPDDGMDWGLDKAVEGTIRSAVAAAPAEVAGNTLNHVLEVASRGGELNLSELAQHMNMPQAQASQALGKVADAFQRQADGALSQAGVADVADFYEWAQSQKAGDLRRAVHEQVAGKGTAAYQQLAKAFLRTGVAGFDASTFDDNSAHQQGIRTFTDPRGKAMVEVHGKTYDLKQALQLGIVAVRR